MFYFSFSFLCWAWSSRALYSRHRSPTEPPSQLSQLFIHEVGAQETAACGLPIILYCNVASHSLDESSLRDLFGLWQRPSFLEPHGRVYRSKTKDVSSPALGRKSSLMPTETRRQGRAQLCPIVHPSELKGLLEGGVAPSSLLFCCCRSTWFTAPAGSSPQWQGQHGSRCQV